MRSVIVLRTTGAVILLGLGVVAGSCAGGVGGSVGLAWRQALARLVARGCRVSLRSPPGREYAPTTSMASSGFSVVKSRKHFEHPTPRQPRLGA